MCKNIFKMGGDPAVAQANAKSQELAEQQAAEARQQRLDMERREAERQARIRDGQERISNNFRGFDEPYFNRFETAYTDAMLPQLDRQYADARNKAANNLASRGLLESSVAAKLFGDIENRFASTRGEIANQARTQSTNLRGRVEGARTELAGLNQSSADPAAVANAAIGRSTALMQSQPTIEPMNDIFASILQPLAAYAYERNRQLPAGGAGGGVTTRTSPNSSYRVVT